MTNPEIINIEELANDAGTSMVVASLAQQAALPRELRDGAIYAILNPEGGIELLETPAAIQGREDAMGDGPRHIGRSTIVRDTDSLIDVIRENNLYSNAGEYALGEVGRLEVWADLDRRTVIAIHDGVAGWRKHVTTLELRHSAEWVDWAKIDGQMLGQVEFAEFIEDHLSSIAEPDGAQLLDICQTLQARTNVQFKQQSILANGQRQFQWEEDVEAKAGQKGDLKIPGALMLALRPFQGSEPIAVTARFRFQIATAGLKLGVRLVERARIIEDAFAAIVGEVSEGLPDGVQVRYGQG